MRCVHCGRDTTERHHLRFTSEQMQEITKELDLNCARAAFLSSLANSGVEKTSS